MNGSVRARRAVEALRAGVPNGDAVNALGFADDRLLRVFEQRLGELSGSVAEGRQPRGVLLAAEFGGGKSHALEFLRQKALERRFAVSRVVISKETQLFDPGKVFRAAVENLRVPDHTGDVLADIAVTRLKPGPRFDRLAVWLQQGPLNSRFAATLWLFEEARTNPELIERLVGFWSGNPLSVSELKKDLRACGAAGVYLLEKISVKALARERFVFLAWLLYAAGYEGWVILLDELELIGRYSILQRGRSYAELARLLGLDSGGETEDAADIPGLLTVGAISPDFDSAVLTEKDDFNQIGFKFRARGDYESDMTAALADRAMMEIRRNQIVLPDPDAQVLRQIFERLAAVYEEAYGWRPASAPSLDVLTGRYMREYIRGWITTWDLARMGREARIRVERIELDYEEDRLLEKSSQNGEGGGE